MYIIRKICVSFFSLQGLKFSLQSRCVDELMKFVSMPSKVIKSYNDSDFYGQSPSGYQINLDNCRLQISCSLIRLEDFSSLIVFKTPLRYCSGQIEFTTSYMPSGITCTCSFVDVHDTFLPQGTCTILTRILFP